MKTCLHIKYEEIELASQNNLVVCRAIDQNNQQVYMIDADPNHIFPNAKTIQVKEDIDCLRDTKLIELTQIRDQKRNTGVKFKNKTIYTDKESMSDIIGALLSANISGKPDKTVIEDVWKCKDGLLKNLTFAQMKKIDYLARRLIQKSYVAENKIKDKIQKLSYEKLIKLNLQAEFDKSFGA